MHVGHCLPKCALQRVSAVTLHVTLVEPASESIPAIAMTELLPALSTVDVRLLPGKSLVSESMSIMERVEREDLNLDEVYASTTFKYSFHRQQAYAGLCHIMNAIAFKHFTALAIKGFLYDRVANERRPRVRRMHVEFGTAVSLGSAAAQELKLE